MKFTTIVFGLSAFSLGALARNYEQASRLVPHLAPRLAGYQAPTKELTTGNDTVQRNFTHDELFALQKQFLDNFVAPNNAIQVRCTASEPRFTSTD